MLAYLTNWAKILGPLGIGLIVLGVVLLSFLLVHIALWFAAGRHLKREQAAATAKWKQQVDVINPLDAEFTRKRINLMDLANPLTRRISNKRLIDCDLMGPANIILLSTGRGAGSATRVNFMACDIIVIHGNPPLNNVIVLEDVELIGGHVYNMTIYIDKYTIPIFRKMNAIFVTLTGIPEIDGQLNT